MSIRKIRRRKVLSDVVEETPQKRKQIPGRTPEARELALINLAYDLLEERIRKKTATSQEVTALIKAGSAQAKLEREKLAKENLLLEAKADSLQSQKKVEELYADAKRAFLTYNGHDESETDDD